MGVILVFLILHQYPRQIKDYVGNIAVILDDGEDEGMCGGIDESLDEVGRVASQEGDKGKV